MFSAVASSSFMVGSSISPFGTYLCCMWIVMWMVLIEVCLPEKRNYESTSITGF